jgi:hypothetical protein
MANATWTDGRESGTGQDTPKVCVLSRPASTLRRAGHAGTLSRPVPLSRSDVGRRRRPRQAHRSEWS